jgi:hypothetical protein
VLDFLEAVGWLVGVKEKNQAWTGTYNKLAKSSMELMTAFDMAIVAQMLEKAVFRHSEFGIRAGLPLWT